MGDHDDHDDHDHGDHGHPGPKAGEKRYWLDDKRNVDKIFYALVAACAATVLADLTYHKHGHFDFEQWIGFNAGFGFLAYLGLVLTATQLRKLLKRDENYYD